MYYECAIHVMQCKIVCYYTFLSLAFHLTINKNYFYDKNLKKVFERIDLESLSNRNLIIYYLFVLQ